MAPVTSCGVAVVVVIDVLVDAGAGAAVTVVPVLVVTQLLGNRYTCSVEERSPVDGLVAVIFVGPRMQ